MCVWSDADDAGAKGHQRLTQSDPDWVKTSRKMGTLFFFGGGGVI